MTNVPQTLETTTFASFLDLEDRNARTLYRRTLQKFQCKHAVLLGAKFDRRCHVIFCVSAEIITLNGKEQQNVYAQVTL
ncbi:unnamed protein product [Allacma fusca]|uniref:Uncharacterized protein n=1 Tax=Allacma fusca TaxID=39272 RepID=A0A8J2L0H9_9HEXA|nr:unnamed protein product [Allacma fusca]